MIIQVVSKKQDILGYLINDVFYPEYVFSALVRDKLNIDKICFGSLINSGVLVSNKSYELSKNFLSDLQNLRLDVNYNNISFICRYPSPAELSELSTFWKCVDNISDKYVFAIVDNRLNIQGYFLTDVNIYKAYSCYIFMFEVFNKDRGIGTDAVRRLKQLVEIRGFSCVRAKNFWLRNGAIFSKDDHFKILREI